MDSVHGLFCYHLSTGKQFIQWIALFTFRTEGPESMDVLNLITLGTLFKIILLLSLNALKYLLVLRFTTVLKGD